MLFKSIITSALVLAFLSSAGGTAPADQKDRDAQLKLSLDWEIEVTRQINQLYTLAVSQKDYASQNFLDWFVEEQVEEINSMDNLLKVVKRAGEKNLIMLEAYLSHGEE